MKTTIAALIIALVGLGSGCAVNSTHQVDRRADGTEITTRAKAYSFAAGKSAMRDFKASQTAKTQGLSVGSLDSESDANPLAQTIGQLVMQGLAAYATGGASTLRAAPLIPPGYKLVPVDDPSKPQPEIAQ